MAFTDSDTGTMGMFGAGIGVLQRQWPWLLAMGLASGVIQAAQKFENAGHYGGAGTVLAVTALVMFVSFVIQAVLLRIVLAAEDLVADNVPLRLGEYFGLSIVLGLAEGLGFLLLIVPGILIMLRWFLAPMYVLSRNVGISRALEASRDATAGHRGAIFGALMLSGFIYFIPFFAVVEASGGFAVYSKMPTFSPLGLANVAVLALIGPLLTAVHIGIFGLLADNSAEFEDVFA